MRGRYPIIIMHSATPDSPSFSPFSDLYARVLHFDGVGVAAHCIGRDHMKMARRHRGIVSRWPPRSHASVSLPQRSYTPKFHVFLSDADRDVCLLYSGGGVEVVEEMRSVWVSFVSESSLSSSSVPSSNPRALFAIRGVTYCVRHVSFSSRTWRLNVNFQSKECQKLSWKLTHKYTCVRVEIPPEKEEALKHYGKIINGWYSLWSEYLDHFALMALDLANNPGKNTTHWYVLHQTCRRLSDDGSVTFFSLCQHVA